MSSLNFKNVRLTKCGGNHGSFTTLPWFNFCGLLHFCSNIFNSPPLCLFFFVIWGHVRFKKRTKFYTVRLLVTRTLYNSNLPLTQLRICSCLACVYRVMDARGKLGEHERCVRVARGDSRVQL